MLCLTLFLQSTSTITDIFLIGLRHGRLSINTSYLGLWLNSKHWVFLCWVFVSRVSQVGYLLKFNKIPELIIFQYHPQISNKWPSFTHPVTCTCFISKTVILLESKYYLYFNYSWSNTEEDWHSHSNITSPINKSFQPAEGPQSRRNDSDGIAEVNTIITIPTHFRDCQTYKQHNFPKKRKDRKIELFNMKKERNTCIQWQNSKMCWFYHN